ncbi:hypothetical protein TNCV_494281 [Trichonephila clavipes]|nr:hypothetical protein TNCV_494281 [Trichonephila clavipes]
MCDRGPERVNVRYGCGQVDRWKWGRHKLILLVVSTCLALGSKDTEINLKLKILYLEDMFQHTHEFQYLRQTFNLFFRPKGGKIQRQKYVGKEKEFPVPRQYWNNVPDECMLPLES